MDLKVKQLSDDEKYLIIENHSLFYCLCLLQVEEKNEKNKALIDALSKISSSISTYQNNERKKGNLYRTLNEVAIEKNSQIGKLIINEITNPEFINLEHLTQALLKSIHYGEWDYFDKLSLLIKRLKFNNPVFKFDYKWFKLTFGEDITNYIANSSYLYPTKSRNKIYLFKNNKITKIDLPEKEQKNPKTRTKTK